MYDFSIEMTAERIFDPRTREYFHEVMTSYINGAYRSATVMLWSVVVCDLLFKLEELRATYGDATATKLLQEVERLRLENPRSPEWESWLVDEVRARTRLLEEPEHQALVSLRQHRHLAAHPVVSDGFQLHRPTREAVRADIRTALEAVLTKPPLMTRKVFDALVEDIEVKQDQFVDESALRRYLEAKFFSQLIPAVSREVFKSLWHVVFAGLDERCRKNRSVNFLALRFLHERSADDFHRLIDSDRKRFSKIAVEDETLKVLMEFLSARPQLFELLTDEARGPLEDFVKRNPTELLGWRLLPGGLEAQLNRMENEKVFPWAQCSLATFRKWFAFVVDVGRGSVAAHAAARAYVRSASFDQADHRYSLLAAASEFLSAEHLVECLEGIENNSQTYGRGRARIDHPGLKAICDRILGPSFDYSVYPDFIKTCGA